VAVVVTVVVALVLAFCGCVGLGVLGSFVDGSDSSGQPYDDPEFGGPGFGEPDDGVAEETTEPTPPAPATTPSGGRGRFAVTYEVTGTGAANIQFYDADGEFLQFDRVQPPWRLTLTADNRERVQIVALAEDQQKDGVSCRITIDGKIVSRDSSATGGVATCFGW
jgi:hypothetical protein